MLGDLEILSEDSTGSCYNLDFFWILVIGLAVLRKYFLVNQTKHSKILSLIYNGSHYYLPCYQLMDTDHLEEFTTYRLPIRRSLKK